MKKILVSLLLIFSCSVRAEVIDSYDALIRVNPDASVTVTETIVVGVEGNRIRRGLVRFLPKMRGVSYSVDGVTRDGRKEPFFIERKNGKYIINTGNDSYLPRKLTTFAITYTAKNVILFFDDHDELYWNVTGDQWEFPIKKATAKVILPEGASITQTSTFIGERGSRESGSYDGETGVFSSGRVLHFGESMTIVASFPKNFVVKGFFHKFLQETQNDNFFKKAISLIVAGFLASPLAPLSYIIFIGCLFFSWRKYGRDPTKLSAMPRFDTVPGMTPAQVASVYRYGQGGSIFPLVFMQACITKFLEITPYSTPDAKKDGFLIEKKREPETEEEQLIDSHLKFPKKLNGTYSPKMEALENDIMSRYMRNGEGRYFFMNTGKIFKAILLSFLLTFLIYSYSGSDADPHIFILTGILGFLSFAGIGIPALSTVALILFLFVFSAIGGIVFYQYDDSAVRFSVVSDLLLLVYAYLIPRPTEEGSRIIEHVDGIKMFLKAVHLYPTSFNDMEKLLPYAVFLGLEKQYDKKIKQFAEMKNVPPPTWYRSRPNYSYFRKSLSSAAMRPSSGSSGHSHGSAGGGFGGGGGGGR